MPAPTTADEFFDLVRKSAVVEESRFTTYVQKLKGEGVPNELNALAGRFVQDGLLTYFQAEQFLQGRWKRFNIGKYRVLEKIGSGGMGQVYLCEHKLMRRRVAVKVLPVNKASDPSSLDRFYREARAVAALDHQNIVRAYDIDQDDNLHFLVMEYVDGSSMQDIIRKTGAMNYLRACHYIYWSAIGLQHAHENGLIHRDIKPGNILVDRQGVVKILDLGLARFFNDDQDLLTKKYDENVLGTADYLAPEQAIDSHSVDGRADIYSLGATFYFLLTGHPPFTDGTVAQKLLWHQTRQPKQVREERPDVPPEVAAVLNKMMAKAAEDRYQTPAELAAALLPFTQTPIPLPVAAEMPQLSVAAMGTGGLTMTITSPSSVRTTTSAPRTPSAFMTPPLGNSNASSVVVPPKHVTEAETRRTTTPVPVVEAAPEPAEPPVTPNWATISADTANANRDDTARRKKDGKSTRREKPVPEVVPVAPTKSPSVRVKPKASKLPLVLLAIAAVVLVSGSAFGIYWFVIRDKAPTKPESQATDGPRQLHVAKSKDGANSFTTVRDAVAAAKPGDTIVLHDDQWEEAGAISRAKGLTITAAEGKSVVWRLPAKSSASAVLTIANSESMKIAGITFHGSGSAEHGLRVSGRCPGMTIENVECSQATVSGIAFHEAYGEDGRPITLRQCRIIGGEKFCRSGIYFTNSPAPKGSLGIPNVFIAIRDCFMVGPFTTAAIEFEGSAKNVDIRNCRIYDGVEGVFFRRPRADVFWQVSIINNTFAHQKGAAIRCEDAPPMKKPENRIAIEQNLFAHVAMVARVDGDMNNAKFIAAQGNFRKTGTQAGSVQLFQTAEVPVDLSLNLTDANVLYYPKDHALNKAHQGKPVGARAE